MGPFRDSAIGGRQGREKGGKEAESARQKQGGREGEERERRGPLAS